MYRIARRQELSPSTFLWDVEAPDIAGSGEPGQFVMVRLHEGAERVPLTIADQDVERGTITLVVQALGRTTAEMRDHYREGDEFADIVGPLGVPTDVSRVGHVVVVGGGLGVAPAFPQLRAFHQAGNRTTAIVGFRSAEHAFWLDELRAWADELVVCTDDGTLGRHGLVTDALAAVVADDRPDLVVAIGPMAMMRACAETTRAAKVRTMVSLNTIMVDGTGMCGSCRVSVDGVTRFACVEGPDFDAHAVDFDELLARQSRFRSDEQAAAAEYAHRCEVEQKLFVDGKRTYKKMREIEPTKVPMPERDPGVRARTFDEVSLGYSLTEAMREAERCLQCARPTCIEGCPVSIDIPRFIRHLLVRDVDGALGVIHEANILPSVCGRVCPQESQCEAQCVIGRKLEPVAIGRLERFIGDHGVTKHPEVADPIGKRVAIVGSGPAGLACAADLVRDGVDVTVFEALHVAGGVLRYGIPAFRLPRDIIDREVAGLVGLGVKFETDKVVGRTFTVDELLNARGFDAVFLGVGAGAPSFLGIPGENAGRVVSANEFLTRVNLMGGDRFPDIDTPVGIGTDVVVVGAGNTAMDCLRVAKRLGARVRCVYRRSRVEAPARVEELHHAEEEGVEFMFLHNPIEVLTDDTSHVRGLLVERMELGEPDEWGRCKPVGSGETLEIECDTVIVALGSNPNPIITRNTPGLALDSRGYVAADPQSQATSLPGVFAGGDIVTGGATVILAMGAGRRAASAIMEYLRTGVAVHDGVGAAAICPRCRRTMDDGDEGICCADSLLTWKCTSCDKRSEGFAFPYGRCTACSGELELVNAPAVTDQARDAIRQAFEIELGGRDFYVAAALHTTDETLHDTFERLAKMEGEHIATLVRRYHLPVPDDADGNLHPGILQAGGTREPSDPADLLSMALELERRAEEFFRSRIEGAAPAAAELYRELAAEELEHVDLLTSELNALRQNRAGLL